MVHTYSMNGINIAVDGNCGSINVLDTVASELLSHNSMKPFTYEQAVEKLQDPVLRCDMHPGKEAWDEVYALIGKEVLFARKRMKTLF
jgi:uncharacterized protein